MQTTWRLRFRPGRRGAPGTIAAVVEGVRGAPTDAGGPAPLVLHVIPTAVARGAQREARALADRLDQPGVRRHRLLCLFDGPEEVPVDRWLGARPGPVAAQGLDPRLVVRLALELRRMGPAAVVAHGGDPLKYLVPALWGWGRRIPLVYYATGTFSHPDRPAQLALWRRLMARAQVVAAEGEEVRDECAALLRVPPSRLVLAPNGRDPAVFHPDPARPPGDPPRAVFVGALTDGKAPERFVAAVAALRRQQVALTAAICGDGPLRSAVAGPAAEAGVELLGTRQDVPAVLRDSDLFVFCSKPTGEGMPGVLIEAGLSGLAVVATAVPGVRSVVADGQSGLIVPDGDADALVAAMAGLLGDPDRRAALGAAARARCAERFSLDAVTAVWGGFLEPLVEGVPAPRPG